MTTDSQPPRPRTQRQSPLGWFLFAIVVMSMIMGTGPGVLLVNRPTTFAGIPLVYAWGVGWYLILVGIALVANTIFWRHSPKASEPSDVSQPGGANDTRRAS